VTANPTHTLLEVTGLSVNHGGLRALDVVDLSVSSGQIVGLIGPNGAGKTTFIDAVTGYTAAASGSVRLDGTDVSALAPHRRARLGMARTFQSLELFDDLTVAQNLAVAVSDGGVATVATDLLGPGRSAVGSSPVIARTLGHLGLLGHAHRLPVELSNGQRHLVALGRAMVASPRVVLLDEPAAGLDPAETLALAGRVADLGARGVGVLLVDHDMDLVMGTCDVVYVVDFGRCIAVGPPSVVRHNPIVREAYLGMPVSGS
jgi:branched-chain amino acid transport system ATP-binding protein